LQVWEWGGYIGGVRGVMNDGTTSDGWNFGNTGRGTLKTFTFQPNETLKDLTMYGTDKGLTTIHFTTSLNNTFDQGSYNGSAVNIDCHQSALAGFYGYTGDWCDRFGFIIFEQPVSAVFNNFTYTTFTNVPPFPVILLTEVATNSTNTQQSVTLAAGDVVTTQSSWTAKVGISVGLKTTLETGIPFVANGKVEVSVTGSFDYSWGEVISDTTNFTKTTPIILPANTKAQVTISGNKYTATVHYTATGTFTYADGNTDTRQVEGDFNGTQVRDGSVTWTPIQ